MRKIFVGKVGAVLTVALAATTILAGCASDSGSSSSSSTDGSSSSTTEAASSDSETSANDVADADSEEYTGEVTTIRVHVSTAPSPYLYVDDDGNPGGFDFAVFDEAISRLPQYEAEYINADDGLTGVLSGVYDVTVGNWVYNESRAESYYFSYPYKVTDKAFVQREDDEPLTDLYDAAERGYSVIVGSSGGDTAAIEKWNEEHPDAQIKIIYSDAEIVVRYQNVADGLADFTLDDGPMISAYFEAYEFEGLQKVTLSDEALSDILETVNTYYLYAKDEAGLKLRDDINVAIKEMYEDGTLEELSIEYFGYATTPAAEDFESTIN